MNAARGLGKKSNTFSFDLLGARLAVYSVFSTAFVEY